MRRRCHRGFTLAESLAASVVLALAVVGISGALIAAQQQTQVQQDDGAMVTIGRQLLEQIATLPITQSNGTTGSPGWPTNTNPAQFDSIDDYNGYSDVVDGSTLLEQSVRSSATLAATATLPTTIVTAGNSPRLSATQFQRTVSVSAPTTLFGSTLSANAAAVVKVTVRSGCGASVSFSRLVFNWKSS